MTAPRPTLKGPDTPRAPAVQPSWRARRQRPAYPACTPRRQGCNAASGRPLRSGAGRGRVEAFRVAPAMEKHERRRVKRMLLVQPGGLGAAVRAARVPGGAIARLPARRSLVERPARSCCLSTCRGPRLPTSIAVTAPSPGDRRVRASCLPGLILLVEAVAQTSGRAGVALAAGSAVGDVRAVNRAVIAVRPLSGGHGGYLVAVDLPEVVGHHQ